MPAVREKYDYVRVRGIGGINQQERLADPELELADARNVWAPDGRLEKRPGTSGVGVRIVANSGGSYSATLYKEDPIGTFTQTSTFNSLDVGERWYCKFATIPASTEYPYAITLSIGATNSNSIRARAEYWNGTEWVWLKTTEYNATTGLLSAYHLASSDVQIGMVVPEDLALGTFGGASGYWIRFTLENAGSTTLDGSTNSITAAIIIVDLDNPYARIFFTALKFPSGTRFLRASFDDPGTQVWINSRELGGATTTTEVGSDTSRSYSSYFAEQPSVAIVPQFGEAYVAYDQRVTVHKANPLTTAQAGTWATVDTDDTITGPGADYDPAFVPQLGSWPEAQYIAFHRGEMWAANLRGAPQQIRWSAAAPAYKVWPQISTEVTADLDESPITGLFALNQNMFVFKDQSIWQMVYTGLNDQKLNTYRAEKVVSGVGCVAQNTIEDINGELVFLGLDGVYAFNGTRVRKLSARVQKTLNTISQGYKQFSVAAHWREKSLYLLAVNVGGAIQVVSGTSLPVNNVILAWDYKNDTWWIWDGFEVTSFFVLTTATGETVYFQDVAGRIFTLGSGYSDNGAMITATVTTQRLQNDLATKHLRLIQARVTNTTKQITVEARANDDPFLGQDDHVLTVSDPNEKLYGVAIYNADSYTPERDRKLKTDKNLPGEWFRVKVTHTDRYSPFILNDLTMGSVPVGVRP